MYQYLHISEIFFRRCGIVLMLCWWIGCFEAKGQFAGGSGTSDDPYLIATPAQLAKLAELMNAGNTAYNNKCYKLVNDLDLSDYGANFNGGEGWIPIGYDGWWFKGVFDGNNKKITGLYINTRKSHAAALFSHVESAIIKNLGIEEASINGGTYVGGIAVFIINSSVTNCYVTGTLNGDSAIGGIAYEITKGSSVSNCYFSGTLNCRICNLGGSGGIIGDCVDYGSTSSPITVTNCYSTGIISGSGIGGIMGVLFKGSIINCYSTCVLNGARLVGGITGAVNQDGIIINCYSLGAITGDERVGGITGSDYSDYIIDCAALNPSIKGFSNVERIAGGGSHHGILSGNIAFCGMTTNGGIAFKGENSFSGLGGENRSHFDLLTADGFPPGFTSSPWTYVPGKLPGLFGKPVDMPDHLRTYVESMVVNLNSNGSVTIYPIAFVENDPTICDLTFMFVVDGKEHASLKYTCADVGSNTVSIVAIDKDGNRSPQKEVAFEVALPPVMLIEYDVIPNRVFTLDNVGSITVHPADFVTNILYECDLTFYFVVNGVDCEELTLSCADVGSRTVSIVGVDELGNRSQSQNVTFSVSTSSIIFDVLSGRDVVLNDVGTNTVNPVEFVTNILYGCDLSFYFVVNGADRESLTITCGDIGSRTVSIVGIDRTGNRSLLKEVTFTISDRTPPVFDIIPNRDITMNDDGSVTIDPVDFVTNISDNCTGKDDIIFRFVINGADRENLTFTCTDIGSHTVAMVAIDGNGNRSQPKETTFNISDLTPPVFDIISGKDVVLNDVGSITLTPAEFVENVSGNGNVIFRFVIHGADCESLTFTCNDIGAHTVSMIATLGKCSRSQPQEVAFTISDRTPPIARCKPATLYLQDNEKTTLTATMIDNGSADNCGIESRLIKRTSDDDDQYALSLDFDSNDLEDSDGGDVSVTLWMKDISGNETTCTIVIRLVHTSTSGLLGEIPEIFTPNSDGFGDTWEIPGIDQYPEATICIYNRTKKLMIELKGAQMPWDGRDRNGNLLESGYYFYQIELRKGGKIISGYVAILR